MYMDVLVATVCTDTNANLLEHSAKKHGIPLHITQRGQPWVCYRDNKVFNFFECVRNLSFDVLVYLDANDVIFTRPSFVQETLEHLDRLRTKFMIAGESNNFPWPQRYEPFYKNNPRRLKYANSGAWAATREGYFKAAEFMLIWNDGYVENGRSVDAGNDDQIYCHELAARGLGAIEDEGRWCLNLYGLTDHEVEQHIQTHKPCIIHGSSGENKSRVNALYHKL